MVNHFQASAVPHSGRNARPHPWNRYIALGDSFAEGIGDPSPESLGGYRGWADRVAEELSRDSVLGTLRSKAAIYNENL